MSNAVDSASEAARRRSARIHLLLIGAVALFPIVGSYLLYRFWTPASHINHGELIAGQAQPSLDEKDPLAGAFKPLTGKWILASVDSGACAQDCQSKLYYMRQLRLTQGKEMNRIERLWIVTDAKEPDGNLLREHAGLKLVRGAESACLANLPAGAPANSYIYVLDPLGNLVLRYPKGFNPTGMKKDLARLLRASRIG